MHFYMLKCNLNFQVIINFLTFLILNKISSNQINPNILSVVYEFKVYNKELKINSFMIIC